MTNHADSERGVTGVNGPELTPGSPGSRFRPLTWIGRHEFIILLFVAVAAGGVWAFAELADKVVEGRTRSFDESILLAMRNPTDVADPRGPEWFEEIARDVTALGGMVVLTFLTLASAGYLFLYGKRRAAVWMLVVILGGVLASLLLKQSFSRPRPDLVPHTSYAHTSSFPSGHSMMSAITYLTLGALMARVQPRAALKAYILVLSLLLSFIVGLSRVYAGVHWPTDVLAGWTAGATWALLCWCATAWLQRHGQVEQDAALGVNS